VSCLNPGVLVRFPIGNGSGSIQLRGDELEYPTLAELEWGTLVNFLGEFPTNFLRLDVHPSQTSSSTKNYILPVPWGLKRFQETRDSHFVTFSCYSRRPNLGTVEAHPIHTDEWGSAYSKSCGGDQKRDLYLRRNQYSSSACPGRNQSLVLQANTRSKSVGGDSQV
jgi:hypothetical protein